MKQYHIGWAARVGAVVLAAAAMAAPARGADEPDLIFRRSTVFKWLPPNDKLATYGLDDPEVDGVSCHFTVPEKGGLKGWIGVAEEVSDISLRFGSRRSSSRAKMCSAPAARCSSRRCRSCAAATPSAMCSSTWFIPTG